ncbi:MAG: ABC transporter ATP-binding protein [Ruminococcus sp.]|uniref:ABC transporter ATP-binding protein n=1 Tax=Ruminococcus sp. TaxID=41978 RepID=UPI0025F2633F|nr:ABC transporter ATP-binding protein [Ruminococcus sp.]MCR5600148.1 ABC transporter ATP-binding protein [Ruminococcus sp.]
MVELKELTKEYNGTVIVNDISLKISDGEFVGIVGESGAGKSTLLYLMSGLVEPTKGQVFIDKKEITAINEKEMSDIRNNEIGFVFQFHNLIPGLSVKDNMEIPLILSNKNPNKYHDHIVSLLESVGLGQCIDKQVEALSGGQQQRVAIARSMVNEPKVIFADEPTGSLDSQNSEMIIDLLAKLNKEKKITVIMVTHSNRTLRYCDRVIKIADGKVEKNDN